MLPEQHVSLLGAKRNDCFGCCSLSTLQPFRLGIHAHKSTRESQHTQFLFSLVELLYLLLSQETSCQAPPMIKCNPLRAGLPADQRRAMGPGGAQLVCICNTESDRSVPGTWGMWGWAKTARNIGLRTCLASTMKAYISYQIRLLFFCFCSTKVFIIRTGVTLLLCRILSS